jgi:hypothetical protein
MPRPKKGKTPKMQKVVLAKSAKLDANAHIHKNYRKLLIAA